MRVALGADHAGFELKEHLRGFLEEEGVEVTDLGVHSAARSDYPDPAHRVGRAVASGQCERGVLVCGSGIGVAISANKVPGIRAACINEVLSARLARAHNDLNVLALGGRLIGVAAAEELVRTFLRTPFDGGRHAERVAKIELDPA